MNEANFGRKKSSIPLSQYFYSVVLFFLVNVLNNYALNFNISMPLHMIFRSVSNEILKKNNIKAFLKTNYRLHDEYLANNAQVKISKIYIFGGGLKNNQKNLNKKLKYETGFMSRI